MNFRLRRLILLARQSTDVIDFSPSVTFIHGPVSTGKSTVARLIDYTIGGELERTPAIQAEFVSVQLLVTVGEHDVQLERGANDLSSVRVTWSEAGGTTYSINAPIDAGTSPIHADTVFNLSDLLFWLADLTPIKVRRSRRDPESPLIRLGFRDLMFYCYLRQDHLDSSFFRLEDTFRGLKSKAAMRFVTGFHSERMSELDLYLANALDEQRTKRHAASQMRAFMAQFDFGTENDIDAQLMQLHGELSAAQARRQELEASESSLTHAAEPLRIQLRAASAGIDEIRSALDDLGKRLAQTEGLRSELIAAKVKAARVEQAGRLLEGATFSRCPRCGGGLDSPQAEAGCCTLCNRPEARVHVGTPLEAEALRRDLNDRIDELGESLARQRRERTRHERALLRAVADKQQLDAELAAELARYDSAYVSSVRAADREIARLEERIASLERLRALPLAMDALERQAGELQGIIDSVRSRLDEETARLTAAEGRIQRIGDTFLAIMRRVGFPGIGNIDHVDLDARTWTPIVYHGEQEWTFYDAGSGGKKTLFNVCYALAVHTVAIEEKLPLPSLLIIDSPTKNISADENPALVDALYGEIYALASRGPVGVQFLLIDSHLVAPASAVADFMPRRMAGTPDAPSLISYYEGP